MRINTFIAILILATSCKIIDPKEDIPTFVEIDSISLSYWYSNFNDHNITDLWVYNGADFLGVFPIPAMIPVYGEGSARLSIGGGIFSDGIKNLRLTYPFYEQYNLNLTLSPGIRIDTTLIFSTITQAQSKLPPDGTLFENFESFGPIEALKVNDTATIIFRKDSAAYRYQNGGIWSGVAIAQPGSFRIMEISDKDLRTIPRGIVFLEFNYASNIDMRVGFYASTNNGTTFVFDLVLNPSSAWKKIYVNLSEEIQAIPSGSPIRITWQSAVPASSSAYYISLDNIRLMY